MLFSGTGDQPGLSFLDSVLLSFISSYVILGTCSVNLSRSLFRVVSDEEHGGYTAPYQACAPIRRLNIPQISILNERRSKRTIISELIND